LNAAKSYEFLVKALHCSNVCGGFFAVTCDVDRIAAIGVVGGRLKMIGAPLKDVDVNPAPCEGQPTGEAGRACTNNRYFYSGSNGWALMVFDCSC
jgi:hypothetical protein